MLTLHFLFRFGVLAVVGIVAVLVLIALLRRDVRRATLLVVVSWGIPYGFVPLPKYVYYADPQGVTNSLSVSSLLLAIVFLALMVIDGSSVARFVRTPVFLTFYVLFACAVLTQGWHLGIEPGFWLAYVRVLQPMMVVILLSHVVRDETGLRRAFLAIIGAVVLAIVLRYAAGQALGPEAVSSVVSDAAGVARVSAVGSWTIYGTVCASTLPLVVSLIATERSRAARVALLLVAVLAVKEVLATGTRGAVLGFAALLLFVPRRRARWWMTAVVVGVLVASAGLGFRAAFSGSRALSFDLGTLMRQPNTTERFDRNLAAWHYIAERPVSGSPLGHRLLVRGQEIGSWTYNPYLSWGVAMGLVALLAFAALVVMTCGYCIGNWRASVGSNRTLQIGLAGALVVWLVSQFTTGDSFTYLQSVEATFFFYAVVGLVVGCRAMRMRDRVPVRVVVA